VNRSQLLNELADRNEVSRREADEWLTSFTELITATVATGETVKVAAKRVARITPLKAFKDAVLSGKAPRKTAAKKAPAKKTSAKKTAKKAPAKKTARRR